ncbi:MAG: ABC-F family ATP-binding cassette domain-containing protein [Actinomycetota bacterium]
MTIADLAVERAGRPVLERVDVTLTADSRLAVIGPNGVGKSTLFATIAGHLTASRGSVVATPASTTIGVLRQESTDTDTSVRDLVRRRTGVAAAELELAQAAEAIAHDEPAAADRYDLALQTWNRIGAADFEPRLEACARNLGLAPSLLDVAPTGLSGGQMSRIGLLLLDMSTFDLTLLDEPTNGLDEDGRRVLDRWIDDHRGGLAVISHDRDFLSRVANSVLEIDDHTRRATLFHGGWDRYVEQRERARQQARDRHDRAVAERDRLLARAQRQREWADQGVQRENRRPRDGDKNIRRRELARTDKLRSRATRSQAAADRVAIPEAPFEGWDLRFEIAGAPRSATIAATWREVVVERGSWSVGPFDLELRWGDRIRLTGANGSGKSTVIDALLGEVPLAAGEVTLGPGVIVGRLDQRRTGFVGRASLLRTFQDERGLDATEARSVLAKFGLGPAEVDRIADTLSPGERTRAQLAAFQAAGVNLLILDEPTNHLDLPAIEQLESALAQYGGTLLAVSHDPRFVDRLAIDAAVAVG